MKILFVLHYPPPVHGAAAIGLQIKESKVINKAFDCTYINLGTSVAIEEIGKRKIVKIFRYLSIFYKIIRNILFNRPDLCYFSMSAKCAPFYKDASLAFLVKLFGIKVIYHFHNKGVNLRQDKYIDDFLYRLIFKNSNVILLSKNLYPDVQKYVFKEYVYYCPNGIPDIEMRFTRKEERKVIEILFLSNLMESKGIFVLLEGCKILQVKNVIFNCTIVGGIGDINKQQFQLKLQEMGLTNCVTYVGEKLGKEKESFFANSDIFIHPTLNDCFPLVLLEAMSASLPIISTFEGGIPDIVEDGVTGFLIPQHNVLNLAEKLELLISNPQLRINMGNAGRLKFEKQFKLENFEHRMFEIINTVVN
jgi:glycosyltransferase involved in cell wall biosynthesis